MNTREARVFLAGLGITPPDERSLPPMHPEQVRAFGLSPESQTRWVGSGKLHKQEENMKITGPSKHFSWGEVQRSWRADVEEIDNRIISNNPGSSASIMGNAALVAMHLEQARIHTGPMHVHSWYRCNRLNRAVGGSDSSLHRLGLAVDVTAQRMTPPEVAHWLVQVAEESGIRYEIIVYPTFVHFGLQLDQREENELRVVGYEGNIKPEALSSAWNEKYQAIL
mgnify:CR=1 FL=1